MIHTLTTNPAIDMNIQTSKGELVPDAVNRCQDAVYSPNGKGLNVSFTLAHYGCQSQILGFFGGFTGDYIVEGARKICSVDPIYVDGITRITVLLRAGQVEYTMPGAGAFVPVEAQQEMLSKVRELEGLECLVTSGSLAPGMDGGFYDELAEVLAEVGADAIFDVSSTHLASLVGKKPLLIKPNDDELRDIFGLDVTDDASALAALEKVCELGAQNILLTMGGRGAYFYNGEHLWRASALPIKPYQTACAGDATLGAFLSVWYENRDAVEDALKRAMATGANAALCPGIGDFARVEEFVAQVQVERVR